MPRSTVRPPAGYVADFRRHADGSLRSQEGAGGPGRLLVRLVAGGLAPDALPAAAALVLRLDDDARSRAEERRERARIGGLARQARRRADLAA